MDDIVKAQALQEEIYSTCEDQPSSTTILLEGLRLINSEHTNLEADDGQALRRLRNWKWYVTSGLAQASGSFHSGKLTDKGKRMLEAMESVAQSSEGVRKATFILVMG